MTRIILAALFAIILSPRPSHTAEGTLVGVLEEPQCKDGGGTYVRVLYAKQGKAWAALNSAKTSSGHIQTTMSWAISYAGHKLGDIKTNDPGFSTNHEWTYPRDRLLNLVPSQNYKTILNRSNNFAGWCASPKNRPLVLVANGNTSDPENWKPFAVSSEQVLQLFADFKARNGKAFTCSYQNSDTGSDFAYGPDDIRVVESYKNQKGQQLVTLGFKPRKDSCGYPDDGWNTQSFLVGSKTSYIAANITFVDSGDYDADGTTEMLFWLSGYNNDGYVLLLPSTGTRIEYLWNYH